MRHKLIFSAERGGQSGTKSERQSQKRGSSLPNLHTMPMKGPCISIVRLHNSFIQ